MNLSRLSPKDHLFAWLLVVIAIGMCTALVVAVARGPDQARLFLDALVIVISWPFAIVTLGFAFGIAFRDELKTFILNISEIWLPGGSKIMARQPPASPLADDKSVGAPMGGRSLPLDARNEELEQKHLAELREAKDVSVYWWFNYLSLFLVPKTKQILAWFGQNPTGVTKDLYQQFWRPLMTPPGESEVIFSVLLGNKLIESDGALLKITQTGREFLDFLNGKWRPSGQ